MGLGRQRQNEFVFCQRRWGAENRVEQLRIPERAKGLMMSEASIDWRALHGENFRGARALVTGGAGFIGSHLAEALVALGASVTVLDDLSGGSADNLKSFGPVELVPGSILDRKLLAQGTRRSRQLFPQAARVSVAASGAP